MSRKPSEIKDLHKFIRQEFCKEWNVKDKAPNSNGELTLPLCEED